jgi:ABC-type dipeptide/oligopeptide/nickel transport system permease subunit
VQQNAFIAAAYATGVSPWRIIGRQILPNVFAPILVIASV